MKYPKSYFKSKFPFQAKRKREYPALKGTFTCHGCHDSTSRAVVMIIKGASRAVCPGCVQIYDKATV